MTAALALGLTRAQTVSRTASVLEHHREQCARQLECLGHNEVAGFIDLVEMNSPIVDGATLGNDFIVYSSDQVHKMTFVGGAFLFNTRSCSPIKFDQHELCRRSREDALLLRRDDIYRLTNSKQSIADEKVKNFCSAH